MNTPITSPFTTNAQPFTFEILPNTQIASSTVTSKVIKAPQQTIKKQVETKKKPVVTKKVTKTSVKVTQPEKQTLWSKMISFVKKFTSGN